MTTATLNIMTRTSANTFQTTRFGPIEIDDELVITLPDGIIGFEDCKRFIVLHRDEKHFLRWFQSLDDGAVAFPIIDPWHFKQDYAPTLSDSDAAKLRLTEETPKLVFAIVTIPRADPRAMTANLLAPLVINGVERSGRQVIVTDDHYTTRHRIIQESRV